MTEIEQSLYQGHQHGENTGQDSNQDFQHVISIEDALERYRNDMNGKLEDQYMYFRTISDINH